MSRLAREANLASQYAAYQEQPANLAHAKCGNSITHTLGISLMQPKRCSLLMGTHQAHATEASLALHALQTGTICSSESSKVYRSTAIHTGGTSHHKMYTYLTSACCTSCCEPYNKELQANKHSWQSQLAIWFFTQYQ